MKKVYLMYINFSKYDFTKEIIDLYNNKSVVYEDDNIITVLYGFTDDKNILDMFFKIHNKNKFNIVKKRITDEFYDILRDEYLLQINIESIIGEMDIPIPKYVYDILYDEFDDYTLGYKIMDNHLPDYYYLRDKYIKALDILMFCAFQKMQSGSFEEQEIANDLIYGRCNSSYEGYHDGYIEFHANELVIYYLLYKYIIK